MIPPSDRDAGAGLADIPCKIGVGRKCRAIISLCRGSQNIPHQLVRGAGCRTMHAPRSSHLARNSKASGDNGHTVPYGYPRPPHAHHGVPRYDRIPVQRSSRLPERLEQIVYKHPAPDAMQRSFLARLHGPAGVRAPQPGFALLFFRVSIPLLSRP